jgi:hypothetical protein
LIREGLATLYLLNLDGCPAADTVGKTASIWVEFLWRSRRREWHMEADTPCIHEAFSKLVATSHRWPAPARFWECLPERKHSEHHALPGRIFSLEERRENLRRLAEIGTTLLAPRAQSSEGQTDA